MADERVVHAMKVVDPATTSQIAGVAALSDNFANPTALAVGAFTMLWDGATWDRAPGNAAGGIFSQGPSAHDAAVAGNPVRIAGYSSAAAPSDVSGDGDTTNLWTLRNGSLVVNLASGGTLITAAALSDNFANPTVFGVGAFLMGYDGTTWDRIYTIADGAAVAAGTKGFLVFGTDGSNYQALATDASGNLQVDVVSGGESPPVNPVNDYATATVNAGSSTDFDSGIGTADLGPGTYRLAQVIISASVPFRAEVKSMTDGSSTGTLAVGFGQAGETLQLKPAHKDYWEATFTDNAGFDGYRITVTNMDADQQADLYCTLQYED